MARRGSKPPGPSKQGPGDRRGATKPSSPNLPDDLDLGPGTEFWAERLRRLALGLLAALIAARAYWPSEPAYKEGAAAGLSWDLAIFLVAALALVSSIFAGRFVFRLAVPDAAVAALMFLVAVSSQRSLDWRIGVNLAWEWAAMGVAYLLLRWLPRTRGESAALVLGMVVTASAVAAYGIYQGVVEIPQIQEQYRRNPEAAREQIGVSGGSDPADEVRRQALENRVLQSTEVFATFGLANSLAGFLVAPLVLLMATALEALARKPAVGASRWPAILGAAIPGLILLTCLVMAKGLSAWLGLAVASGLLVLRGLRLVPRRVLMVLGVAGAVAVAGLVVAGVATRRLDVQILTQATRSLRYRFEYWRSTWAMITEDAPSFGKAIQTGNFWKGVGPGNFGTHYVRYKLPEASEEIQDPHNLFLDVWSTAGVWAFLALVAALGSGIWILLTRGGQSEDEDASPTDRPAWLLVASGLGLVMVLFLGRMNLFMEDLLTRWLVLLVFWVFSAALLSPLWRLAWPTPYALGAAMSGVTIALLTSGGVSFPAIAMMLWGSLALGLNLRDPAPSGRLHSVETLIPVGALSLAWAALIGGFFGATLPFWKSEAAVARAEAAMQSLPPDYDRAETAYKAAETADRYNVRPWLGHAYLQLLAWQSRGSKAADLRWETIRILLEQAVKPPRNPDSWGLYSERASTVRDLLRIVGPSLSPREILQLQADVVKATRVATRLYPNNPVLHGRLAEASAEMSMFRDAADEANEAIRLDALTPHADKKLPDSMRRRLQENLPKWTERAAGSPQAPI
ncbi:O-antigen ligase family protein [Paludisphaera rhizosphaerae]|uniref:O-antigen ligase family protein n=1 Tax=Paludisphaera rhizosphaerae TaxID=2711216 RepID=UPI0013EBE29B|nr:O-antigen ligase family protein [Paludisphaera rhizosphaerae]